MHANKARRITRSIVYPQDLMRRFKLWREWRGIIRYLNKSIRWAAKNHSYYISVGNVGNIEPHWFPAIFTYYSKRGYEVTHEESFLGNTHYLFISWRPANYKGLEELE